MILFRYFWLVITAKYGQKFLKTVRPHLGLQLIVSFGALSISSVDKLGGGWFTKN